MLIAKPDHKKKFRTKIKATTILRLTDLSDPATAVMTVATFDSDHYADARECFFEEIRKAAALTRLAVHEEELEAAEEDGHIEIGDHHIYLLHSYKDGR